MRMRRRLCGEGQAPLADATLHYSTKFVVPHQTYTQNKLAREMEQNVLEVRQLTESLGGAVSWEEAALKQEKQKGDPR